MRREIGRGLDKYEKDLEEDVEGAAQLFINTLRVLGIEEESEKIDLLNEDDRVKGGRKIMNQLYDNIKKAAIDGYISREKVRRLGRSIKLTENESDECMKVLQENGYITSEKNDKIKLL